MDISQVDTAMLHSACKMNGVKLNLDSKYNNASDHLHTGFRLAEIRTAQIHETVNTTQPSLSMNQDLLKYI